MGRPRKMQEPGLNLERIRYLAWNGYMDTHVPIDCTDRGSDMMIASQWGKAQAWFELLCEALGIEIGGMDEKSDD